MKPLILFDIDGTLLSTEGAGRASLTQAFQERFGVEDAFAGLSFAGATDLGITGRAFAHAGLEPDFAALEEAYLPLLSERLGIQAPRLCPGVPDILAPCAQRAHLALLTGNWLQGARIKLQAAGLLEHFDPWVGAFGDDAADRNLLVPVAEQRAREQGLPLGRTVVIGDTPRDVECARAGGAIAVAVCTGWSDRETLAATEPDLLIEDLHREGSALLRLLENL